MRWVLGKSTSENAIKRLPGLAAKYFQAGRGAVKAGKSPADLHAFRVKTKQFRYALELFQPVYGPPLDQKLEALHEIQKVLGQISDVYTTRDLLKTDRNLKKQLNRRGKKKIGKFKDHWEGTFDARGELKAWKKFLSTHLGDNLGQAVSTPKPRKRA
ncbi:MAG: CHAD domain-containing protein [Bryobacteraceae bacterium]